jgi:hypothetical protein
LQSDHSIEELQIGCPSLVGVIFDVFLHHLMTLAKIPGCDKNGKEPSQSGKAVVQWEATSNSRQQMVLWGMARAAAPGSTGTTSCVTSGGKS